MVSCLRNPCYYTALGSNHYWCTISPHIYQLRLPIFAKSLNKILCYTIIVVDMVSVFAFQTFFTPTNLFDLKQFDWVIINNKHLEIRVLALQKEDTQNSEMSENFITKNIYKIVLTVDWCSQIYNLCFRTICWTIWNNRNKIADIQSLLQL